MSTTRFLTDEQLLAQSREERFRGSGPGGQKRNKTSNSIRLTHLPSGISATAGESRSLTENKLNAIRRLRMKMAIELREPIDLVRFEPPEWFISIRRQTRVEASHRHPLYYPLVGLTLDLLTSLAANPASVAINLGISTTMVIKILESDPRLWVKANQLRAEAGLSPLQPRR